MRFAALSFLALFAADVTPKGSNVWETRWSKGDFVAISNQSLDRLVEFGQSVGLQISGQGESCLLRRRVYTLRLPCRLKFRVRWTESKFEHAFPSVHVVFNPPPTAHEWWSRPTTRNGSLWSEDRKTFLFHFATRPDFQRLGITTELESATGTHRYCSEKGVWVDLEIRLTDRAASVFAKGQLVATYGSDFSAFKSYTFGIGDQTSTFVELDEFGCEAGR